MRDRFTDPDETCDEGEADDYGALYLKPGEVLTVRDGRWVVVSKGEITAADRAAE